MLAFFDEALHDFRAHGAVVWDLGVFILQSQIAKVVFAVVRSNFYGIECFGD